MRKVVALFVACGALTACNQETLSPAEQAEIIGKAARGTVIMWKGTGLSELVPQAIAVVCETSEDGIVLAFVGKNKCSDAGPSEAIMHTSAHAGDRLTMYFNASPIIATGSYHRSVEFTR